MYITSQLLVSQMINQDTWNLSKTKGFQDKWRVYFTIELVVQLSGLPTCPVN